MVGFPSLKVLNLSRFVLLAPVFLQLFVVLTINL